MSKTLAAAAVAAALAVLTLSCGSPSLDRFVTDRAAATRADAESLGATRARPPAFSVADEAVTAQPTAPAGVPATTTTTTTVATTTTTTAPPADPPKPADKPFDFGELKELVAAWVEYEYQHIYDEPVLRWVPMLLEYDWPIEEALAIIDCESSGDPAAVNPTSRTTGLFQVHPENLSGSNVHTPLKPIRERHPELRRRAVAMEWLKIPANNLEAAYAIYVWNRDVNRVPWREWTCRYRVAAALRA